MNMVKRIMGRPRQEECSPQDNALGLMHLRRLFSELCHPPRHMTQKEQEEKLYMMLPVFNRVFGNAPPNTMTEKFSDLLQFTTQVSRLMVTEIRRRASNKSTEAASRAIVQFLEINQSEEASRGWMLLTTINLLASSGQKTVDCMTTMSVPSTLVKCLYLFFDLPHVPEAGGGAQNELPLAERRGLLQKVFVQILVKLCSFVSPAEELAQKDDLQLLFSAITSWCPPYNLPWRKSAGEVLTTISRHGLSVNVVKYIHEKECLSTCVQNMQQSDDLSPLEIVEMFAGLSCFLKDSSGVSQTLLDDFRIWQGYNFLCDLLLRLEQAKEAECRDALKDLVNLVTSLTTYGVSELKPAGVTTGAPFLLPGFTVPQPAGKGHSVRNVQAFAVLQNAFLKAKTNFLAQIILDAITNIYMADNANYFILESQHTLSQFAEKIAKLPDVQNKYFEMLEFVVFSLNYIPCKELISVSILLKSSSSYHCSIIAMKTLLKFTRHDYIFKDVFREVGLLEVMVNLLHKYAALLKDPAQVLSEQGDSRNNSSVEDQEHLALLVMEALTVLLQGSHTNAGIFREFGGARCAHNIVRYPQCRQHALMTIQQLVLSPNGDDDMGTLLGLMHSAPPTELQLKTDILRALLSVLRESHRSRTVFRKVGGFVYITSLLVAMERSLSCPPKNGWEKVSQNHVFELLHTVFCTLTAALRYEPANSHFFKTEIQYEKLADAVRFLGCFSDLRKISAMNVFPSNTQPFQRLLEEEAASVDSVAPTLRHCSKLFIYLYKVATDSFDSRAEQIPPCLTSESSLPSPWGTPALSRKRHAFHCVSTPPVYPAKGVADLKLDVTSSPLPSSDAVIIHPGAMLAMLDLLASVGSVTQPEHALDLQLAVANILQSLVHTERNQQVMCEAGLHARLLQRCSAALADEDHSLHPPLQRMFERLASQALEPMVLREFLRLASPLNCGAWDKKLLKQYRVHKPSSLSYEPEMRSSMVTSLEGLGSDNVFSLHEDNHYRISKSLVKSAEGSTVPLTRVKCLVSMTTPHDIRLHGSSVTPAFVEFDTSLEGFGCLFLPSLAPHNAPTNNAVTTGLTDGAVVSGIGSGERFFPPPSGLSYSSWFCIEHFSSPPNNHPVRLLTVVRRANSSEQHYVCLAIVLSAKDRSLIVSTKEELLQNYVDDFSEESSFYEILPCCARFRCGELIVEGQWHHLVLLMSKGMLKNSTATLYIDGQLVSTVKLHYVHSTPGGSGSANPPVLSTVYAYIGTPPAQRHTASLVWRLGPTHFLEEVLPPSSVTTIYELGPNYVGSFQAVCVPCKDVKSEGVIPSPVSLVAEEKVSFGLYALSVSSLTVARIRKVYNKLDSKAIAKQLGISSHENATPVKLVHNAAGHLNGPARTIGAALIGYLGVRTFVPKPVATTLQYIGGAAAILGLVAMASDVEGLYAAVKALVCVVKSNPLASKEMERIKGYQLLAMLLKKKRSLLNSHILHLTFSLVGTVDSGHETSIIPNSTAFQDLLCDFEVWLHAPYELHLSLFEHFIELLTESSEASKNAKLMREFQLIPKLLLTLRDMSFSQPTIAAISNVLSFLLQGFPSSNDLLRFGQFISSTLPTFAVCEKFVVMEINNEEKPDVGSEEEFGGLVSANLILLRNRLLDILLKLVHTSKEKTSINLQACEELVRTLGFDWILMFMEEHLHPTTVTAAMRILVALLSNQSILIKFKEGLSGGGWLEQTDSVLTNKIGTVLGFNVGRSAGGRSTVREINREACHFPGFLVLQAFLPKHTNVPALYFLLMALFLQQPVSELPENLQVSVPVTSSRCKQGCKFDLDSIWTFIFGVPASSGTVVSSIHNVCTESAFLLLGMLRSMLNSPWQSEEEGSWLREYPVTLMQFFRYLYHNVPDLASMWMSPDFLCALAATVFPFNIRPYSEMVTDLDDEVGSPAEEFKAFAADTGMNRSQSEYCNVGTKTYLTNHPAKKFVFDFMRVLMIDNLCLTPASKQTPLIDLLLEASPERSTRTQQKEFQTHILDSVMDHLLAADVLLGEDASLPITSGGSYQVLVNNVFYFTQRVVDKLWQGMFNKESKLLIDFIIQLIAQSKRRSQGLSLDAVYHCLNRTILYQFSRAHKTVPQQVALLDSLRVLTVNRNLILGPGNHDQEFISCLAHCLINLHVGSNVEGFGLEAEARMTTWHIMIPSDIEPDGGYSQDISEGRQLLIKAVNRVWTELIHSKKQVLEELFRVSLPVNDRGHVDIATARPLIEEAGLKCWQNHLAHEKKCISRGEALVPTTQSKLSRVSSGFGLSKLTGSRRNRKESGLHKHNPSTQEISQWMFTHIAVVRDLVDTQYKEYQERQQNALKYVTEEWCQMECELLRERGLWGPPIGSHLDKWMLEMTEGPCRMRKKMVRNDMFYNHYPYVPETEQETSVASEIPSKQPEAPDDVIAQKKPARYRRAISYDSKEYYFRLASGNPGIVQDPIVESSEGETTQQEPEHGEDTIAKVKGLVKPPLKRSRSAPDGGDEETQEQLQDQIAESNSIEEEEKTDNATLLRLLEEGEKIQHMYRCARVQGLDTSEGLLLFGKEHFYVIDGFTMTATREIRDIETLPPNMHEPIIPRGARQGPSQLKRTCSIFAYEDIKEVHKRRYLLQPIAVEVFSGDGRNYLLAFQKGIRNKVYQRFLAVVPSLTDSSESVSGQRPNTSVEQGSGLLSTLVGEKSVTQRWERGEISNFQYLMHLNTLAGRSYNDLMQYPVFPWILADYDSEEVDLTNPKTFRNLAKPMGAQTDERLAQYKKRYKDWEDPNGETPAYHYGTHYSSAMIVASYLVRMEPFTQIFLRLQGGHFDLADRMFHSVREAWYSASKHNMADVKELIPEFFYLPEFLFNSNNFDLGCKQNGTKLGDVILPPWAKGDPREFIRVHREALECDYVSAHLHEWIDLIFGYKQQGPAAVEAVNVFHHLFYEGQVDIYNINDPLKETATIGFINNFGQIPKQLFKKPHPPKRVRSRLNGDNMGISIPPGVTSDKLFFHHLDNLRPSLTPVKELKEPVGQIVCTDKGILAVEQNKVLIPPAWNKTFAWGYADLSCRLGTYESDKAVTVYECLSEWGQILCAICPNPKLVITGGTSTVVCVWEMGTSKEKAKPLTLKQALLGHTDTVTCATASLAYHIIVSGSRDRTCIIWDLNRLSFLTQLRGHRAPVSALCINELTGDIVSCAGTHIHVWSINGNPIVSVNTFTGRSQQIVCCCVSEMNEWDTQNVIVTGHSDGVVRFWRMEFLQVPETPAPEPVEELETQEGCPEAQIGQQAQDEDSTDSETEEPSISQEPKETASQPSSTSHRPRAASCRATATWCTDSSSDDSRRWSDQLSLDEKDGFIFVNYSEGQTRAHLQGPLTHAHPNPIEARNYSRLKPGYRWERQLVFRSKLTMHTAFDRKDNAHPAEVTALGVSKDHSRILVGDSRGRVFSWSVSDQPGRSAADHWVKDEGGDSCSGCSVRFSLTERRHHCRNCGQLFCQKCSRFQSEIKRLKISSPVRVCQNCYYSLQHERGAEDGPRNCRD
ncbi:WD repeat and FYVE domain-containing protein 3 isoform X1 [Alexandromys fortis]|uniref:WD repeat and FYVE domain-containing protein 3 isoform X1 n=1 Tax=Alexandromys fortis TaxID=100897 RepID=UPI00215234E0|nr:WD repeat and FYVE domain-containing protein 3 isoform X1 [Microtus fortis]XP_050011533.1 WD repeat and FYVE domain-containing protein 3 isoform X1 [Microtus fortis]XP_050011534.1 WD repeat and FYVE domain-containing protein 3 isoform X1 [Microtus fortis]XP_050011535.1 WD repeat and FYVE domain-containing protein 3 isoform X1 [Microtus fortis]XP_050011536.1 WD repeat and FYVE domain-containing protein 3 isoform X1 [Microtus fortis]